MSSQKHPFLTSTTTTSIKCAFAPSPRYPPPPQPYIAQLIHTGTKTKHAEEERQNHRALSTNARATSQSVFFLVTTSHKVFPKTRITELGPLEARHDPPSSSRPPPPRRLANGRVRCESSRAVCAPPALADEASLSRLGHTVEAIEADNEA